MFRHFQKFILGIVDFSAEDLATIQSILVPLHLSKGAFLLQQGQVCTQVAWVAQGCLRLYLIDKKAKEHIIDVGLENAFITDRTSLLTGMPTLFNIDALEDSDVLLLPLASLNELIAQVPQFERVFSESTYRHLEKYQNRIAATLSLTADEKYKLLVQQNPDLLQRVPQHMIASYLGIKAATLIRIKRQHDT